MAIEPFTLKKATRIDKPTADSAAATTRTKKAKNWPQSESKDKEAQIKIKLIANNKSSIDISRVKMFFRFTTIPSTPIKNNKKKISINSIEQMRMSNLIKADKQVWLNV